MFSKHVFATENIEGLLGLGIEMKRYDGDLSSK